MGPASKAMDRSGRRSRRAALQRQVEAFNVWAEMVKVWERLVRIEAATPGRAGRFSQRRSLVSCGAQMGAVA